MLKIKVLILIISLTAFFTSTSKQIYYETIEEKEMIETTIKEINGEPLKKEELEQKEKIKKKHNYKMIIEIPSINLKKGILDKNDKNNNVDKNVAILPSSVYPGEKGNIYIAAHSGTGIHSYFNKIDRLENDDIVNLYYNNKKYSYELYGVKYIEKNRGISLLNNEKNTLFLITCSQKYKNKYLILYFRGQNL